MRDGVEGLLLRLPGLDLRAVDGHDVPLRAARRRRVRRDDLDVLGEQVVEALDALGVAGAQSRWLTTELLMMPLVGPLFQSSATSLPASTRLSMSGSSEKSTKSAGWPASTARRWSPEAAERGRELDAARRRSVSWKAGDEPLLERLLGRRVGDQVDVSAAAAAAAAVVSSPPQAAIPSVAASAIPAIPSRAPVRRRRFFFSSFISVFLPFLIRLVDNAIGQGSRDPDLSTWKGGYSRGVRGDSPRRGCPGRAAAPARGGRPAWRRARRGARSGGRASG